VPLPPSQLSLTVRHQLNISAVLNALRMAMAMGGQRVTLARLSSARERHNTRSHIGHAAGRLIRRVDKR
jgi:hypothetical protein